MHFKNALRTFDACTHWYSSHAYARPHHAYVWISDPHTPAAPPPSSLPPPSVPPSLLSLLHSSRILALRGPGSSCCCCYNYCCLFQLLQDRMEFECGRGEEPLFFLGRSGCGTPFHDQGRTSGQHARNVPQRIIHEPQGPCI